MVWEATRKNIITTCKIEEVQPGRFVKKCEKTEQILRNSFGGPEVVESKTENTEEDVTDEVMSGKNSSQSSDSSGSGGDCESITLSIGAEFRDLVEVAEEMANDLYRIYETLTGSSRDREPSSSSSAKSFPEEKRQIEAKESGNAYDALPGKAEDV